MNILFAFAHPDDEAYGPAGTIKKLVDLGHNVWILSLCRGNRPGAEHVMNDRQEAFFNVCNLLGATGMLGTGNDVHLDYHYAVSEIESKIKEFDIDIVYTHCMSDLHKDHRTAAEACLVAARPKPDCNVNSLFMCEIGPDWSFGTISPQFNPNTFIDVSEYIAVKKQVLSMYHTETYEFPDARSVISMEAQAMRRGAQIGCVFAEAFQLVYSHDRGTW
jgi:LmbE family N-acetylglucosaminyl deacetylase